MPAPSLEAAQWIALAEPAPFGRGKKTIIDPAVLGLAAAAAMMRPDDIRSR